MFNELALFITDNKIQSFSQGTSGGVEFDFFCAWELWKKQKFDKLIMVHTHPDGFTGMSSTDLNMLKGWCKAFPVPIIFAIATNIGNNYDEYSNRAWIAFYDDNKNFIIKEIGTLEIFSSIKSSFYEFLLYVSHNLDLYDNFVKDYINNPYVGVALNLGEKLN